MSRLRAETEPARTSERPAARGHRTRRATGDSTNAGLLDLQATAGNAAVARIVAPRKAPIQRDAEPPGTVAEKDKRISPDQVRKTLADEHNRALAGYHETGTALDVIAKAESAGQLSAEDQARKAQLEKAQGEHHAQLTQAEKDLRLLDEPGATDQALNEMRARRAVDVKTPRTTESSATGVRLDASGITSATKDVTSELQDGKATTTTSGSTKTLDTTGYTKATSKSTSVVEGGTTTTRQEAKDNTVKKYDISGGDLAVSSTSTDKTTKTTADGSSESDATVKSTKYGPSGYTTSTEKTVTADDTVVSSKQTTSFTRGDGKAGASRTKSSKVGSQDSQGVLTKGVETSSTVGGGVSAGPEGVGGYASATAESSKTHAKGVKTGQSMGMDGKFVVNVTQVPGKDPPQYQISLTINLGAKLGASGSAEKETSDGRTFTGASGSPTPTGKATAGASGSVSGSVTGTFVHVFDAEKAKAYLGSLAANGTGGAEKEMRVLALAAKGSLADAEALLRSLQKNSTSAAALASMNEGDSVEIALDGKAEGGVSAGHSETGGFGLKGSLTMSHSKTLKASAARKDGKIVLTVTELGTDTLGGGGTASFGAVSGGRSQTSTTGSGESISFTLDEKDPAYRQHLATVTGANSMEDLRQLAAKHPELVGSRTTSKEEGGTGTTSAGGGGITLDFTDTHGFSESTTADKDGTTYNVKGSKGGGATLSGPGGMKASYSEQDTVATKVGPDKQASGDSYTTTSETDYAGSAEAMRKKLSDAPVATLTGLATGGTKWVKEKTDVAGLKLSDADYETIATTAQDPRRWDNAGIGTLHTRDLVAWRRLAKAIVRSHGDRAEIGRLIARFADQHDDTAKAINRVVRPAGTATGGAQYEWPGELADEKASYEALVTGDPTGPAKQLDAAGKRKEALDTANAVLGKLDALVNAMRGKRDKFIDGGALAEMLTAAATRRGEIAGLAATLRHNLNAADPKAAIPPPDVTTVPTPEQAKANEDVARENARGKLEGLRTALAEEQQKEDQAFNIVREEQARWFFKPDIIKVAKALTDLKNNVYPRWENTLREARELAKKAGVDEKTIGPVPNKTECNSLNHKSFGNDLVATP